MGEVSALGEGHAHEGVAGFQEGLVDGQVGWRSRQGLDVHVDVVGAHPVVGEALGDAPPGQALDEVHVFDALVEAPIGVAPVVGKLVVEVEEQLYRVPGHLPAGVAFGVDVVEDRAQRLPDGLGAVAFGGDEDDFSGLPLLLELDQARHIGVYFGQLSSENEVPITSILHLLSSSDLRGLQGFGGLVRARCSTRPFPHGSDVHAGEDPIHTLAYPSSSSKGGCPVTSDRISSTKVLAKARACPTSWRETRPTVS